MAWTTDSLALAVENPTPTATVIRVAGDLNLTTAPRLARLVDAQLGRCVANGRSHLVVDLACVRHFGRGGLQVLHHAQLSGLDAGVILHLSGLAGRAPQLPTWVPELLARFDTFPTLEDALAALRYDGVGCVTPTTRPPDPPGQPGLASVPASTVQG